MTYFIQKSAYFIRLGLSLTFVFYTSFFNFSAYFIPAYFIPAYFIPTCFIVRAAAGTSSLPPTPTTREAEATAS